MIQIPHTVESTIISLPATERAGIELTALRLDKIDPIISGNKLFKLHYYIDDYKAAGTQNLVTMGGAYSNHLVATAQACMEAGLHSTGIVRGEAPAVFNETLMQCQQLGMNLLFIARSKYKKITEKSILDLLPQFQQTYFVPEGGFGLSGAKGASHIMQYEVVQKADTIVVSAGTGTTLAGLILGKKKHQKIIASPAIKSMIDLPQRVSTLLGTGYEDSFTVWDKYHFGGYAKHNQDLLDFMNTFYTQTGIPTDKVYTAKMFFGLIQEISNGRFKPGEKIVAIHTGGLQGNRSLPPGSLIYE